MRERSVQIPVDSRREDNKHDGNFEEAYDRDVERKPFDLDTLSLVEKRTKTDAPANNSMMSTK